jgi:hypothetical protein
MPTMHLDISRGQMVAMLEGEKAPPPAVGDPGDLYLVLADVFPSNGTVATVLADLSEYDMRWGGGVISGVSALDGAAATYWANPVGDIVPSGQALFGFPLNGSAPVVVPYGTAINVAHMFYSAAQGGLLVVTTDGNGAPTLARFSPPSPVFKPIFSWNATGGLEDFGVYDVSPDGTKLLSVLTDKNGERPRVVVLDLVHLKELARVPLQVTNSVTICDISFCNI